MEMWRSAPSATRRSQLNAATECLSHQITAESPFFSLSSTGLMSSWLSVLACWWLSFCFTSSSPVATHPKRPYSLVINPPLSLSQLGNMFPNTLTSQVNLRAASICGRISTFPELSHETQTAPTETFSKPLRTIRLRMRGAPGPAAAARDRRTSEEVTLEHNLQNAAFTAFAILFF